MKFTKLKLIEDNRVPARTFDAKMNAVNTAAAERTKTLNRIDIDDDTKVKLLGQNQRYQTIHLNSKPSTMQTTTAYEMNPELDAINVLPISYRERGKQLLQRLKTSGKVNEQGQLLYNGQPVEGTNIVDLLDDVLRRRKTNAPTGWDEFSNTLQELNIPKSWIGNTRYKQQSISKKRPVMEDSDVTLTQASSDDDDDSYKDKKIPKKIKKWTHLK